MIRLGFDVDGVLRDVMSGINNVFKTHYPQHMKGEIAYDYDFPHIDMPLQKKYDIIFNKYPKDVFLKTEPYLNTVQNFKKIKKWAHENNIKLVCATSQEKHLIAFTYLWLAKYNIVFEELHISKNKGNLGLDYLVDDAPHNYDNWLENINPEENFILMDRDWNQEVDCSTRIKNISDVIDLIEKKWKK